MPLGEPLPFRLKVPGQDVIDTEGVWSISYKAEGLLHLDGDVLVVEWQATRTTEKVAVSGIGTDVDHSPIATLEVPIELVAGMRYRGGWWWPRLELRGRTLDAFDGIPGARPGVVSLRVRRRDRAHARGFAAAFESARREPPLLEAEGHKELPP